MNSQSIRVRVCTKNALRWILFKHEGAGGKMCLSNVHFVNLCKAYS